MVLKRWIATASRWKRNLHAFLAVKEPNVLTRVDSKRPDSLTIIPWMAGKLLTLDVTVASCLLRGRHGPPLDRRVQRLSWQLSGNQLNMPILSKQTCSPSVLRNFGLQERVLLRFYQQS